MLRNAVFFVLLMSAFSCSQKNDRNISEREARKVNELHGHLVPDDSLAIPMPVSIAPSRIIKAGQPKKSSINTNTLVVGPPSELKAGVPETITPGKNNIPLPRIIPVIENMVISGMPEMVTAKDGYIMENNQKNFSSFGKLQGLNANSVNSIAQDHMGNLWLGSNGGVTRYDGKSFAHYSKIEGLASGQVLAILFDRNNDMWMGTADGGISKFDGKYYRHYSPENGSQFHDINEILEDRYGNLWFGTSRGIVKYDGISFTHFTEKEGLVNNEVHAVCEDKEGLIWFGTLAGVSVYDGESFSNYSSKNGLVNDQVRSIIQDKKGNYWFGTNHGAIKFDGKVFSYFSENNGLSEKSVFSILEDKVGNIWFGTWGHGVCKFDGESFSNYSSREGLINNEIKCLFQDDRGIIWLGTRAGGISRYYGDFFDHLTFKEGLPNTQVQSIIKDRHGNLWFGTWGEGVYKYDGNSFSQYTNKEGLYNNDVRTILEDRSGNLWFGSWGGVSKFDGEYFTQYTKYGGLDCNMIISSMQDKDGNLWFGTEGKGVFKYDGNEFFQYGLEEGISGYNIKSMIQDRKGKIWFATNHGLTIYEESLNDQGKTATFTHITEKEGLPDNNLISLREDQLGNIWIGSTGGGLAKYDGRSVRLITKDDGLIDIGVLSILEDRTGNLWFGTRAGLSKLEQGSRPAPYGDLNTGTEPLPFSFTNYNYDDGFSGIGCNANAICEDKEGAIWIGANNRITILHLDQMESDTSTPNIQLRGIDLFNEEIPWKTIEKNKDTRIALENGVVLSNLEFDGLSGWYSIPENLSLAHDDNFLTFHFIGITTKSAQNVEYMYKLDGLDKNWSTRTKHTSASYGNLDHGTYTFRVKSLNNTGYWSEDFIYKFTIRPPWWKTNWAYFTYIMAFIALIIIIDRIQTARVVAKERERTRERELKQARQIKKAYEDLHVQNEIVKEQKLELEKEKKHSDDLLLNILPAEVADELKEKGYSEAKHIEEVSVLFTDFQDFTKFSEELTPKEVVAEMHECFSSFDRIVKKYQVEKIKTIGDSYMAAGGIPIHFANSVKNTVMAALEMQEFMVMRKEERSNKNLPAFEMRVGIHSGPIVAGIVGMLKFQYDIWGDTVNTASRMESSGKGGKVNISQVTYEVLKTDPDFKFIYRGKIEAKNKGVLDMYFVEYA